MARERLIAGLDIGTTKTCAVLAEQRPNGQLQLVAAGVEPSRGMKRGVVVNMEEASLTAQTVIEQCERVSGRRIGSALVSVAGNHIESHNTRGVTTLSTNGHGITPADMQKAIDSALAVTVPPNKEIVHVVPRRYVLDGQDGIKNPLGMRGYRLEVETHIIMGAVGSIHNLIASVRSTALEVDDVVLQPLASAQSAMTEEERDLGGVLVDIGGGTTDIAVFLEGSVWHSVVLPVGGTNVTNDIAVCLHTPLQVAEELKIAYGHTDPAAVADLPQLDVTTFERGSMYRVPRDYVAGIIRARMEEILEMVAAELRRGGYSGLLGAGVVLTGGVAEQPGLKELAESILDLPVRIGQPRGIDRIDARLSGPAYATAMGLLLWAQEHRTGGGRSHVSSGPRIGDVFGRLASGVGGFFRAFLP